MDDLTVMQFFNNVKNHVECKQNFKDIDAKYLQDMIKDLGYKRISISMNHIPGYTLIHKAYAHGTSSMIYELGDYRIKFTQYKNGRVPMTWAGFWKRKKLANVR